MKMMIYDDEPVEIRATLLINHESTESGAPKMDHIDHGVQVLCPKTSDVWVTHKWNASLTSVYLELIY